MHDDGSIDFDGLRRLAVHLADNGHDGLLVNGTTGESATTTDDEDYDCVQAVVEAVGDRVSVMAGCGTNDTEHSMRAAREMVARGADTLLVVTPYYNKPTQQGIVEHFRMIGEAADRPIMAYDIPGRTGLALTTDTIRSLDEIPQVRAIKDAKGDLFEASRLMAETDLLWFSGMTCSISPISRWAPSAWSPWSDTLPATTTARWSRPSTPATCPVPGRSTPASFRRWTRSCTPRRAPSRPRRR
ncbi:dihydrodipicolinate synthase family protein [Dietzia aerolata]